MKFVYLTLAVIFLLFAAVQYNDPDPMIWIVIYGYMAGVCMLAAFNYIRRELLLAAGAIYLIYALFLTPAFITWLTSDDRAALFDEFAKMQFPYIEETREFLGLVICLSALLTIFLHQRKRTQKVS